MIMNELIHINYSDETPTVNGRELHAALEVKTAYKDWFPRMCEYGFIEGKSYFSFLSKRSDGLPGKQRRNHELTISMAKELCMLQRSEKGKQFREYFIRCEEVWNTPDKVMERAWQIIHARAEEAERRIFALSETNETLETALNESLKFYTVAKYNRKFKKNWSLAECRYIGKQLSAYCRAHAIEIRNCETNDERFGNVHSYPLTAWEDYLAEVE
jgi:phage anti-repressor protein